MVIHRIKKIFTAYNRTIDNETDQSVPSWDLTTTQFIQLSDLGPRQFNSQTNILKMYNL